MLGGSSSAGEGQLGEGRERLGKLRLSRRGGCRERGFPAEATAGLKGGGDASGRSSRSHAEARGAGAQRILGLRQAEARPYLVGRHQIQVTRVHGVKLHHVVHRLPVCQRHHLPAHHLHALIQVDLGGCGGGCPSGDGAPGGRPQVGAGWGPALCGGAGCPKLGSLSLGPFQDWRWQPVPTLCPLLCAPPPRNPHSLPSPARPTLVCTGPGFTVKKTFSGRLWASCQGVGTWV